MRNNLDFFIKQNNKLKLEMKQTFNAAEAEAAQRRQWQPTSGKLEPTHTHIYRETQLSVSAGGGGMGANMANEKFATLRQKGGNAFKI